jgi:radical SAM-linked protein
MHVFERMLRRADLPMACTQGFHPQPRMVFALSLALGALGANEVLELELTEPLRPEHVCSRLADQAPPGLEIRSVRRLEGKSSSLVRRAFYRLPLQLDGEEITSSSAACCGPGDFAEVLASLPERCRALYEQAHVWVERSRPRPRRLDIRPYLSALQVQRGGLEIAVWVTPTGTARPDEYARLLGLEPLLQAGAYFERADLEMMDESSAPLPGILSPGEKSSQQGAADEALPAAPGPRPVAGPTALVPGPLSFDS